MVHFHQFSIAMFDYRRVIIFFRKHILCYKPAHLELQSHCLHVLQVGLGLRYLYLYMIYTYISIHDIYIYIFICIYIYIIYHIYIFYKARCTACVAGSMKELDPDRWVEIRG